MIKTFLISITLALLAIMTYISGTLFHIEWAEDSNSAQPVEIACIEIKEPEFIFVPTIEYIPETTTTEPEPEPEPVDPNKEFRYHETEFVWDVPLSKSVQKHINRQCKKYDIAVELILAIIRKESRFEVDQISRTNDYGLMQINVCNHDTVKKKLGITDILDPKQNITAGTYLFYCFLVRCDGDIVKALMAYNMGYQGAKKRWNQGIFTTGYTDDVIEHYQAYVLERIAAEGKN